GRLKRTRNSPRTRYSQVIYIYQHITANKKPPSELRKEDILLLPKIINHLPWGRGYFETVANWPIREGDVYERHCFKDTIYKIPKYYDELGNEVPNRFEPCSFFGLSSYAVVDYELSQHMGIPLAEESK
nr:hypothetical protein [Candidatus Hydrogenedentota bacterium]